jgi:DNA (cytosine-5)-methyltransferase 1
LKRAEKRGKELPPILKEALIQQAGGVLGLDCFDQCLTGTVSKTLTSSATDSDHVPCVLQQIVFENHSQDSRYRFMGDVNETVSAKYGTGGNNQPLVLTIVKECGAY